MNIEHYENLVGMLTRDLCIEIFQAGDKLMSILEEFGVSVEYGDGFDGELFPSNRYMVTRQEGYVEEYEDDQPPEEFVDSVIYNVNLETGMAEDQDWARTEQWPVPPWLLSLIRQHNQFHIRAYGPANAVSEFLGDDKVAIKYLDGEDWGYEVFKDGRPFERLPEGRNR